MKTNILGTRCFVVLDSTLRARHERAPNFLCPDKALSFSRNQVFCLKNWKFWQAPMTMEFKSSKQNLKNPEYLFVDIGK